MALNMRHRSAWPWTILVLGVLVLGGGNWTIPVTRLFSTVLASMIAITAIIAPSRQVFRPRAEDWIALAIPMLVALQMIPLPPAIWSHLPGRDIAIEVDMAVFANLPWRPLSLDVEASLHSLGALLPPAAVYLAMRTGGLQRTIAILDGVQLAIAVAIGTAGLQWLMPEAGWLHLYPRGDYQYPIGFFTNHNHQAIFLACGLPLLALSLTLRQRAGALSSHALFLLLSGFAVASAAAALATASRTGTLLMVVSLAITFLIWRTHRPSMIGRSMFSWPAMMLTGCLIISLITLIDPELLSGSLRRSPILEDQRWSFWPEVYRAAVAYWPVGSGIGTFVDAYAVHEPLRTLTPNYVNHAHNEYLEIMFEAGLPGLLVIAVALGRLIWVQFAMASTCFTTLDKLLVRLAAAPVILIAVHSAVDYPARTYAISCILALCWAIQANQRASNPAYGQNGFVLIHR